VSGSVDALKASKCCSLHISSSSCSFVLIKHAFASYINLSGGFDLLPDLVTYISGLFTSFSSSSKSEG
jgi:hypothetical protein